MDLITISPKDMALDGLRSPRPIARDTPTTFPLKGMGFSYSPTTEPREPKGLSSIANNLTKTRPLVNNLEAHEVPLVEDSPLSKFLGHHT